MATHYQYIPKTNPEPMLTHDAPATTGEIAEALATVQRFSILSLMAVDAPLGNKAHCSQCRRRAAIAYQRDNE